MNRQLIQVACALAFGITAFAGCKKSEEEKMAEAIVEAAKAAEEATEAAGEASGGAAEDPAAAMRQVTEALKKVQGGKKVPLVDFRELKKRLPEEAAGWKRTSAKGSKTRYGAVGVSRAEATYSKDAASVDVELMDFGGMHVGMMGLAAWAHVDIDEEDDDGYRRTTVVDGKKAFEEYNHKEREGELGVIVANRFMVKVEGDKVEMKDLKALFAALPLDDLGKLVE
jgi:hypothetical protein